MDVPFASDHHRRAVLVGVVDDIIDHWIIDSGHRFGDAEPGQCAMSSRLTIVAGCGRAACRREESPMSRSMVYVIAFVVRRSGAMSVTPC
jgi:hypothetical protein